MEENIQVSVIMPVHNGEKYLRDTLECVVKQTLKNIEIICVNDGSNDTATGHIAEMTERHGCRLCDLRNDVHRCHHHDGLREALEPAHQTIILNVVVPNNHRHHHRPDQCTAEVCGG